MKYIHLDLPTFKMTDLEKQISKRKTTRSYLDKVSKAIQDECKKNPVDLEIIASHLELFEKKLILLDEIQDNIESLAEESTLDGIVEDSFQYRTKLMMVKTLAEKNLNVNTLQQQPDDSISSVSSGGSNRQQRAALPKINLPKFDGKNPTEWSSFIDQFEAVVHTSDLPEVSKFVYLRSLLKGEASSVIEGLNLTNEHYTIALELLKARYGRKEKLIFHHIQELLSIRIPDLTSKLVSSLWALQDKLLMNIRALEQYGIGGDQYGVILTPLVLSRLPQDLRMEWAKDEGKESDLQHLLSFLKKEIERRERSQTFSLTTDQSLRRPKTSNTTGAPRGGSATALTVHETVSCHFCSQGHPTEKCYKFRRLNLDERHEKIKSLGLCFRCLNKNCYSKICKKFCSVQGCENGRHHFLLCRKKFDNRNEQNGSQNTELKDSSLSKSVGSNPAMMSAKSHSTTSIIMQIMKVPVQSKNGKIKFANVLLDTGSDKTYISSQFCNEIKPKWEGCEPVSYTAFGSKETGSRTMRNVYTLLLSCKDNQLLPVVATEIPVICAPLVCPKLSDVDFTPFNDVELVNCFDKRVNIDILIGLDCYWSCMKPGFVKSGNLVAQETLFGWVLSGLSPQISSQNLSVSNVSSTLLSFNDVSQADLHKFWDLESIGISDCNKQVVDPVLIDFNTSVIFSNGRYEVSLPWKNGKKCHLQSNMLSAKKRLDNLTRKLNKDPQLEEGYFEYFNDLESKSMIEEVKIGENDEFPVFYLPHRPVVRSDSLTTKIRPVFDASAAGPNCISLNDCLSAGPNLLPDLVEILLRFRRWPIAVTGDIKKAFLQVQLRKEDRDVHRFLLPKPDGQVRVMRFTRVTFGINCSPFLLNAVIKYHLQKQEKCLAVQNLEDNLYVDDFLTGGDSPHEVCSLIRHSSDILASAGFTLGKWKSNDPAVGKMLDIEFSDKNLTSENSLKVLGIRWFALEDCLGFDSIAIPPGLVVTKRVVLSFIARLFDPLGFVNPFIMTLKCIFQELWKLGLPWDDVIPDDLNYEFFNWCNGLNILKDWKIPRSYTQLPWKEIISHELHAFSDASQKGYGVCVYLVSTYKDGQRKVSLVISRARVAPLKIQSLPKLELLAAVLCARLVIFTKKVLKLADCTKLFCWSDSQVTLTWIRGEPHRWKTFIANRVMQIHELTDPAVWGFVSGSENPADLVTRGISAQELIDSHCWLQGPEFLKEASDIQNELRIDDSNTLFCTVEQGAISLLSRDENSICTALFEVNRWNSFTKAIRIVSWVMRFLHNIKPACVKLAGNLTLEELTEAKLKLLCCVQRQHYVSEFTSLLSDTKIPKSSPIYRLNPFIGVDGLIRVGGRLEFAQMSFEEKHPVILPKCHLSLLLVQFYHTIMKHAGVSSLVAAVRRQYWIVSLRTLAKRVKRECISCQKQDALACDQATAPLPEDRITRAPPFGTTGLDHAGPLFCSDFPKKKFYILLFTCGVIRAVHLELVDSLNVFDTALAFRRFVARRGLPSVIYSDNAKTFVSIRKQLISIYDHTAPKWKMIAPRSPWWGGFYERLVRSVKTALRKSLGSHLLTRCELETAIHEVELCINSRPLTFVGDGIDSGQPLSPAHFLMERPMAEYPEQSDCFNVNHEVLVSKNEFRNKLMEQFWLMWQHDYLKELPKSGDGSPKRELSVDSVVLVRESGLPRLQWPLGRVTKLFPGKDGKVRSVEVKTSKGIIVRSVQLLHDLEISQNNAHEEGTSLSEGNHDIDDSNSASVSGEITCNTLDQPVNDEAKKSKYGRLIKSKKIFDM